MRGNLGPNIKHHITTGPRRFYYPLNELQSLAVFKVLIDPNALQTKDYVAAYVGVQFFDFAENCSCIWVFGFAHAQFLFVKIDPNVPSRANHTRVIHGTATKI